MTDVEPRWRVTQIGVPSEGTKPYAVRLGRFGPYAVGRPGRYRPNGAIITFRSWEAAQRRADELNQADRDREENRQ